MCGGGGGGEVVCGGIQGDVQGARAEGDTGGLHVSKSVSVGGFFFQQNIE